MADTGVRTRSDQLMVGAKGYGAAPIAADMLARPNRKGEPEAGEPASRTRVLCGTNRLLRSPRYAPERKSSQNAANISTKRRSHSPAGSRCFMRLRRVAETSHQTIQMNHAPSITFPAFSSTMACSLRASAFCTREDAGIFRVPCVFRVARPIVPLRRVVSGTAVAKMALAVERQIGSSLPPHEKE